MNKSLEEKYPCPASLEWAREYLYVPRVIALKKQKNNMTIGDDNKVTFDHFSKEKQQ
jgi:hypothetical protein